MSPDLLETIQQSPLTPWVAVAGAILLFLGLCKFIVKTTGKLVVLALLAAVLALGWNWWGQPSQRSISDIGQDWFASVQNTDLSSKSIEALARDTSRLLKEVSANSQAKGREVTTEALDKMADTLRRKMQEASASGEDEAAREFKRLHEDVMDKLGRR